MAPIPQNAETFITRQAGGARISLPVGQQKPGAVGYETRFRLRGDFEVIATLKTTPSPKAWGPGIDIHLRLEGADNADLVRNADLMLERRQLEDGRQIVQPIYAYELSDKLGRPLVIQSQPTPAAAGKRRIVRKGPVAYYLFAERDSDDYRLISEHLVGEADAVRAQVYARAFSPESGVEVVLEQLSIRAESFKSAR